MAITQKDFYSNDNAPNTLTTVYTVPSLTSAIVTCITIVNKSASTTGISVLLKGVTVAHSSALIEPYTTSVIQLSKPLSATETIQVQASASSTIALTISGVEVN